MYNSMKQDVDNEVWKRAGNKCQICKKHYSPLDRETQLVVCNMTNDKLPMASDCLLVCHRCKWFITTLFQRMLAAGKLGGLV